MTLLPNINTKWLSLGINIVLIFMVGSIGFMAHDIYKEIRAYPNTMIKKDVRIMQKKMELKAGVDEYDTLCDEVEKKADKETMNRLDRNIQKRLDLLVAEVRLLRKELSQYFYQYGPRDSSVASFPILKEEVAWESIQRN